MKLMKCGHVANATAEDGSPCCVICMCMDVEKEVSESYGLEGRTAKCCYGGCGSETPSKWTLPFFKHQPKKEHDEYYCGCWGWD